MPDSSGSTWWGRASALALGDFKRDAFARDTRARAVARSVALFCVLAVVIFLAIFCLIEEPAMKNRTHTYRVTNVRKVPTGKNIQAAYCPCSQEPLLWPSFVTWPRFPAANNRQPIALYCAQLRNITGTASLADQIPVTNAAPPSPAPRAAGRRLRQTAPAVNLTTVRRVRGNVLQVGCSSWVQDVVMSLHATSATYKAEVFPATELRTPTSVKAALRVWLGLKLKTHLQAQYRVAAAVFGAAQGNPLPESFAEILDGTSDQLDNMLNTVHDDVAAGFSYETYADLCKPHHCDVTATKPRAALMVESIGVVGGLWALMLLGGAVLWQLAALLPLLQERDPNYADFK